ncbi:MAG TPA: isoprenylcysteine carboxylmethyltransferase family protein [Pyrinomonadaceae bacterium]|nr:isoprenylcysteine carboxylmethyltransferase family protein [Pyrinomonadaceae bacterium]
MNLRFFYLQRGVLATPPLLLALVIFRGQSVNGWLCWSVGLGLFTLGLLGRIWAQQHLHYRLKIPMALTRTGPYTLVRNPIYICNTLMVVGLTFTSRVLWLVPITLIWMMVLYSIVVREEEGRLSKEMGEPYLAFLREVPRWVPRAVNANLGLVNQHLWPSIKAEAHNLLLVIPFVIKEFVNRY